MPTFAPSSAPSSSRPTSPAPSSSRPTSSRPSSLRPTSASPTSFSPTASGVICATADESSIATISCPSGTVVRSIDFASYGTPIGSCGAFSRDPNCDSSNSMSVVTSACLNEATCTVAAQNSVFGDPCEGTGKQLYIQAGCGLMPTFAPSSPPSSSRPSSFRPTSASPTSFSPTASGVICAMADETTNATISCSSGTFVRSIDFASYGTPTGSCGAFSKGSCDSSNSMSVVTSACLNKATCTVAAQNSVFGLSLIHISEPTRRS